ncbi:hypothetical protein [Thermaerobacillus caldiproteolyticus]|uniref:hypothetical protein n=1 Tax=Thermaerobacillus caldiproteolyticus TaxID=247480 RepID=UPI00188D2DBF|nr:hypothetical protein [Anoxybacillus caldiproteolyticus]QPA33414.1 hypothetical protein ISX45_19015 [Anoxybacillus caldiproteolyticus]
MENQKVLEVLNSLEVIEKQGGEDSYMLVENNEENRKRLNDVGVSNETIDKYGDNETFCILALAFGEGYADFYQNGKFIKFDKSVEIETEDETIMLFKQDEDYGLMVIPHGGGDISEVSLTEREIKAMRELLA